MIRYETRPDHTATIKAQPRRCRRTLVERIADAIREMGYAGEPMTLEAFRLRGFGEGVMKRFGPAACELARRRSVRHVNA